MAARAGADCALWPMETVALLVRPETAQRAFQLLAARGYRGPRFSPGIMGARRGQRFTAPAGWKLELRWYLLGQEASSQQWADILGILQVQGERLDQAYLGMAQVDAGGNVKVSRFGKTFAGCGGFINISQNARKVVFVGTLTCNGLSLEIGDGRLRILTEGHNRKFVPAVEQVTFSGKRARELGHETMYVTERAVFRLTENGLRLEEIAPGIELERDVLAQMEFTPEIKRPLGTMDPSIFRAEPMGLRRLLEERPIASRFQYDPQREVLFIDFAGLAIKGEQDLRDISAAVEAVCAPLGRRIRAVVDYDGFSVPAHLADAYAGLVRELTERYYERVTRYTSSAFLRLKLGASLAAHQVDPELFDTQRRALESLKDRRRTRTSPAGSDR